jgi:hypothetical protein
MFFISGRLAKRDRIRQSGSLIVYGCEMPDGMKR